MLRLHPDTPPHVLSFEIDGTVTAPDMDDLYNAVERVTGGKGPVHICGEIHGIGGLTLDAVGASFKRGLGLIGRITRVKRYAVVTDTGWIRTLAELQGAAVPGLTVRVWPTSEREDALAWAAEPPEAA
ncbi:MAG: STAS/SEC14 domain-containing protein [Bacteroidota bacterium]